MKTAIQKMNTQLNTMAIDGSILTKNRSLKSIFSLMAMVILFTSKTKFSFANGTTNGIDKLLSSGENILNAFAEKFKTIGTALAGVCLFCALAVRMMSKNPRTVEEATVWAKRVFTTYFVLVLSGFIFKIARGMRKDVIDTTDDWGEGVFSDQ